MPDLALKDLLSLTVSLQNLLPLPVVLDDRGQVLQIISGFSAATHRKLESLVGLPSE